MLQELFVFFQSLGAVDYIFIGFVTIVWLVRFFYDLFYYGRLAFYKVTPPGAATIPFSILLIERNEEENLQKNLPGWLSMGYPLYEICVVNDFSEDNSLMALALMRVQYPRLKFTSMNQETRFSEKLSRNVGLKAVENEVVVIINSATLVPDSHWLPGIASAVAKGKKVMVGYSNLAPGHGGFHKMFRIESFFQQIESMAYCINGMPFVVSEENIAFYKKDYFNIGGFAGKMREEFLNLELVINQFIKKSKTTVFPASNMALRKESNAGRHELTQLIQKSFSLKRQLKKGRQLILQFFNYLHLMVLPLFILMVILYPMLWLAALILLSVKTVIYMFIIKRIQNRLNEPKIFISSLIYGFLAPYYKQLFKWRFNSSMQKRRWIN